MWAVEEIALLINQGWEQGEATITFVKGKQTNPSPPEHPYINGEMQIEDIANRRLSMERQYPGQ